MRSIGLSLANLIHVAVAIVANSAGEILIARRPEGVHLAGFWEFPGGKVDKGEEVFAALQRELLEETGLQIETGRQLIKIIHHYPEKSVKLDTWLIESWSGTANGLEGQEIRWVSLNELQDYDFPEADRPIISALSLSSIYQISPEPEGDLKLFLARVESCLEKGVKLFQLRAKMVSSKTIAQLAQPIQQLCEKYQARWLINGRPEDVVRLKADGVHLSSMRLLACKARPLADEYLIGASCHNAEELVHAGRIGVDFVVLSPISKTLSHSMIEPLGWEEFEKLVETINLPVYALGGMGYTDLAMAWKKGAQGVATIRSGWPI